ncbi:Glucose-repressible protein and related proteins [Phaffia rhodozyma]|uniref:Glucose-repressible protein and related proteins n=1 Tax=Phaffia rhodozyma TaxID=264483 RepID=A0A0F7SL68_PHARH|nr:Glucose-repressible protein and related proteins [Phaffia rhodozyma]
MPSTFVSAIDLIQDGTSELEIDQLVKLPNLTLMDAMNAIEIMDPRMDTGVEFPEETAREDYDPFAPLLPEEIAWILERVLACEMAYHQGSTLAQTVYTILPLHPTNLKALDLENLLSKVLERDPIYDGEEFESSTSEVETRPIENRCPVQLRGLVLRGYLMGVCKSIELTLEEFRKSNLYDGEDFSGDRFGLALCDDVDTTQILDLIQQAQEWLSTSSVEDEWKTVLMHHLNYRHALLVSLQAPSSPSSSLLPSINSLHITLQKTHVPTPTSKSRAHAAIDAAVSRRLDSHVPLGVLEIEQVPWDMVKNLGSGLEIVSRLGEGGPEGLLEYMSAWSIVSKTRPQTLPIIRSLTISTIYSSRTSLVLNSHPLRILSDHFFESNALLPPRTIELAVELGDEVYPPQWRWSDPITGDVRPGPCLGNAVKVFEQRVSGFLVNTLINFCQNRPRQKRMIAKSISQWEELYDEAIDLIPQIQLIFQQNQISASRTIPLSLIPLALHAHRLFLIRHVIFSGFELELYDPPEHAMIFWAGARLFGEEESVWNSLRRKKNLLNQLEGQEDKEAAWEAKEMQCRALGALARQRFLAALPRATLPPQVLQARFKSRFKWVDWTASVSVSNMTNDRFILTWSDYHQDCQAIQFGLASIDLNDPLEDFPTKATSIVSSPLPEHITMTLEADQAQLIESCKKDQADGGHPWFPRL